MEVLKLSHTVAEKTFEKIVAVLRLALPYTGMILSTRESPEMRKKLLKLAEKGLTAPLFCAILNTSLRDSTNRKKVIS
jgi:2-iminoacetate synthase